MVDYQYPFQVNAQLLVQVAARRKHSRCVGFAAKGNILKGPGTERSACNLGKIIYSTYPAEQDNRHEQENSQKMDYSSHIRSPILHGL